MDVLEGGFEDVGEWTGEGLSEWEGESVRSEVVNVPMRRGCGRRMEECCGGGGLLLDMVVTV